MTATISVLKPTSTAFSRLLSEFEPLALTFMQSPVLQSVAEGTLRVSQYASIMRQIFHHARENPQIQVLATVRLRGYQREAAVGFYRHAASEVGHDRLALNDCAACGVDVSGVPWENPLPATSALLAYPFFVIYNQNPVAYLGYLFFLEFLPTSRGSAIIERLKSCGVPDNAFSFLRDHTTVDVGHNKAMERYCEQLLRTDADVSDAIYTMRTTAYLYQRMLESAVAEADRPGGYGQASLEMARRG